MSAPFACPPDQIEIVLDLPIPPSANRLWRFTGRQVKPYPSPAYKAWIKNADAHTYGKMPKRRITGAFTIDINIAAGAKRRDGDNLIKAALDWAQSREIIRNDSDCRQGSWAFVDAELAPLGCRLTLRSAA
jgi:Holliday junction resolvase RusA-like endonuclease